MVDKVPAVFAKIGRISFLARNGTDHQVIRMEIIRDEDINTTDLDQIKKFCQENLNPEAEINAKQVGITRIIGISKFTYISLIIFMYIIKI